MTVYVIEKKKGRIRGVYSQEPRIHSQIIMFVKVSGFGQASGITLPLHVRNSEEDTSSVVFAVVRWLSAHPSATLRDSKGRPVCPPPLDTNHALWTYSKLARRRAIFYTRAPYVRRQLSAFAGSNEIQRIRNSNTYRSFCLL